jgi:hypothetical protein
VPGEESVPRPPKGYIISFVAFHKRGFSIPAWAIRPCGPLRVRAPATAPQFEQHP